MIAFVKGILDSVSEDKIIVENQNIGFEILVPGSSCFLNCRGRKYS